MEKRKIDIKKIFKNNKKKIIVISIILLILLIIIISNIFKPKETTESKLEIEPIKKRSIGTSIAATGVIEASNTKNVVSTLTGSEIKTVNVKEGDKVTPGQVICTFDTSTIQDALNTAQKSLGISQAQANVGIESARRNLNDAIKNKDTQISTTQADVDNALKAYQDAQNQLENAKKDLSQKQLALDSFNKTYGTQIAEGNAKKNAYDDATNKYNTQLAVTDTAKLKYETFLDPVTGAPKDSLDAQYVEALNTYNSEQQKLLQAKTTLDNIGNDYLAGKANYDNLNSQLQNLTTQIAQSQSAIPTLEQTVNSLKTTYEKASQALNSASTTADSTIASMQDSLSNAELSSDLNRTTQQAQIDTYKDQISKGILTSTVSGTVTAVNVKPGDIYSGSTIAVIDGVNEFIIEAEIDEYDIADINVGMEVLIKTDATRDEELKGRVIFVASSATENQASQMAGMSTSMNTSGNATYKIQISLDSENDRLRLGMNAKLSIITDSRENVWAVPIDAIHERDNGTKYIEVLKNENENIEQKQELDVVTGLESSYYVEINSDKLTDGMQVIMPEIEGNNSMETLIELMGADAGL